MANSVYIFFPNIVSYLTEKPMVNSVLQKVYANTREVQIGE